MFYGMKSNTITRSVILCMLPAKYTIRHSIEYLVVIYYAGNISKARSHVVYGVTVGATALLPRSKLCVYEVFEIVKQELIQV